MERQAPKARPQQVRRPLRGIALSWSKNRREMPPARTRAGAPSALRCRRYFPHFARPAKSQRYPGATARQRRTRAKRRFGSSLSTATNKNAPAKQIAKTYRRTITAIKSGNLALSGQDLLAADAIILGCPDSFPSIRQLIDAAGADCLSVASGWLSAKRAASVAGLLLGFLRHRRG